VVRKKPQVPNSNLKNMLIAFLAPEEDSSEVQKEIDGDIAQKISDKNCDPRASFSTAAESMCQYMENDSNPSGARLSFSEKVISCM
jgi:hypothetical protein